MCYLFQQIMKYNKEARLGCGPLPSCSAATLLPERKVEVSYYLQDAQRVIYFAQPCTQQALPAATHHCNIAAHTIPLDANTYTEHWYCCDCSEEEKCVRCYEVFAWKLKALEWMVEPLRREPVIVINFFCSVLAYFMAALSVSCNKFLLYHFPVTRSKAGLHTR